MTDLKNIYDYLEKIDFEKRIKEEVKFIRDRRNSPDFEAFVSPFVITQFVFSIVRDFYEEIYKDIEKQNAQPKELLKELIEKDIGTICDLKSILERMNYGGAEYDTLKNIIHDFETDINRYEDKINEI